MTHDRRCVAWTRIEPMPFERDRETTEWECVPSCRVRLDYESESTTEQDRGYAMTTQLSLFT